MTEASQVKIALPLFAVACSCLHPGRCAVCTDIHLRLVDIDSIRLDEFVNLRRTLRIVHPNAVTSSRATKKRSRHRKLTRKRTQQRGREGVQNETVEQESRQAAEQSSKLRLPHEPLVVSVLTLISFRPMGF